MKLVSLLMAAAVLSPLAASADTWPSRPVKVIVPYAPGGATDNATRPFMEKISASLGQQFVIENKGGASGAIGVEAGAKSAPDGYTFFMAPVATVTIVPIGRKTPYDPFKDMVPVGRYVDAIFALFMHPAVPANSLKELVAHAKANPGKVHFASSGIGTSTQMAGEILKKVAGIDIVHVPYRGGAESLTDLLAGQVQLYFEPSALPHAKAGKVKMLAVIDSERSTELPDVPTMAEALPGYDLSVWFGMFAPAGTPQAIVAKMNAELNKAAQAPDMRERLAKLSLKPRTDTPEEHAAALKRDYDRYGALMREIGMKLE